MKKISKFIGITLVTGAALTTTACNTIQGAGQDIKALVKRLNKQLSNTYSF